MHYEGDPPHPNATQWAVSLLPVSKTQRYTDSGVAAKFWNAIDTFMTVQKPFLMPKT
jgi:hypothetical protein